MKMYRLRAQVADRRPARDPLRSAGASTAGAEGIVHADPRGPAASASSPRKPRPPAGCRRRHASPRTASAPASPEEGRISASTRTFAHDIGMDLLDGIDFEKGCYIGQEVVSRMKHRGTARRRPVIVSGIEAPAGTPVLAGGREAGTIGEVVDGRAVAILRLDRITDPAAVTVDGKPVTLTLPAWATYQFGESAPRRLASLGFRHSGAVHGARQGAGVAAHAVGPAARYPRSVAARCRAVRHRAWPRPRRALERPDHRRLSVLGGAAFGAGARDCSAPSTATPTPRAQLYAAAARCARICDGRHHLAVQGGDGRQLQGSREPAARRRLSPLLAAGRTRRPRCRSRSSGPTAKPPSSRPSTWPGSSRKRRGASSASPAFRPSRSSRSTG